MNVYEWMGNHMIVYEGSSPCDINRIPFQSVVTMTLVKNQSGWPPQLQKRVAHGFDIPSMRNKSL